MDPVEITGASAAPASGGLRPNATGAAVVATAEPDPGYNPNLASGKQIFTTLCATCHGESGEGGHQGGVPLKGKELSLENVMTMASFGKNTMPGFAAAFSKEQIQDVASYVLQTIFP